MRFYLGIHRPYWWYLLDVPVFISASTVAHYVGREDEWPMIQARPIKAGGIAAWAVDSGAFTAWNPRSKNRLAHPWHWPPDEFGGFVVRLMEQCGVPPQFAAIQDVPCEEGVRRLTGFSVAVHQELTSDSYQYLTGEFDCVPWIPVLQGWEIWEYLAHMDDYHARGIDLSAAPTVGLGSVCRRGSAKPIVQIVEAVQAHAMQRYGCHLKLHGFGMNIEALRLCAHLLASSDSMAWSQGARKREIYLPGCEHPPPCNNCWRWALEWRDGVLAAIAEPKQLDLLTA